jgi:hypothetical protein
MIADQIYDERFTSLQIQNQAVKDQLHNLVVIDKIENENESKCTLQRIYNFSANFIHD